MPVWTIILLLVGSLLTSGYPVPGPSSTLFSYERLPNSLPSRAVPGQTEHRLVKRESSLEEAPDDQPVSYIRLVAVTCSVLLPFSVLGVWLCSWANEKQGRSAHRTKRSSKNKRSKKSSQKNANWKIPGIRTKEDELMSFKRAAVFS